MSNVGSYCIGRELGRGGMAVVHEAVHEALGKRVAIKLLHPGSAGNAVARARFAREARIAASLRHPHIAEIYDFGRSGETDFLAMELADQGTLASLVNERPLPLARAVELFLPILSAIAHAHEKGVVHRDLKPENVLLALDRFGQLTPKVADFGIGKSAMSDRERITDDGRMLGTLPYMAPEQIRDARTADAAADQYALGLMFYQAVTGKIPYRAATNLEWMHAILAGGAAPPSQLNSELPSALDDVILKAISVDADARYSGVLAFGSALLPFASGGAWSTWARELGASSERTFDTADGAPTSEAAVARDRSAPSFARTTSRRERTRYGSHVAVGAACALCTFLATSIVAYRSSASSGLGEQLATGGGTVVAYVPGVLIPDLDVLRGSADASVTYGSAEGTNDVGEGSEASGAPAGSAAFAARASIVRSNSSKTASPSMHSNDTHLSPSVSSSDSRSAAAQSLGANRAPILQ